MSPGAAAVPFLVYHCPKLRSEHFRSPCEANISKVTKLRQKYPQALLGPMTHCLDCQGRHLVIREQLAIPIEEQLQASESSITEEAAPLNERNIESKLNDNPLSRKGVDMKLAGDIKPETTKAPQLDAPRCPKHPQVPQVACSPESKKAGQYLGACKVCMAERKLGKKPGKIKEKMTPAVARDLARKKAAASDPICKNHPDRPAKLDSLGRSMGLCNECLSARGRKGGIANHKAGLVGAPVSIPLNLAKYAEVKAWLEAEAEENERTLQQQIMFLLRQGMRRAAL